MKSQKLQYKILCLYQIVGGVVGIVSISWLLLTIHIEELSLYLIITIAILLYLYSILCGIMLIKNTNKGLRLSLINQLMQIICLSIIGFSYKYFSGLFISIGWGLDNSSLLFNFGASSWELAFNDESVVSEVHINIIALFLVFFIDRLLTKAINNKYSSLEIEK